MTGVSRFRDVDSVDLAGVAEEEDYIRRHLKEGGPGAE